MSNLIGKIAGKALGGNSSQSSSGDSSGNFSGVMHKVTDAVTGQKHPQDVQNETFVPRNAMGGPYYPQEEYGASHSNQSYGAHQETRNEYDRGRHENGQGGGYYSGRGDGHGGYEANRAEHQRGFESAHGEDYYSGPRDGHGGYDARRGGHENRRYEGSHEGGYSGGHGAGYGGYQGGRSGHGRQTMQLETFRQPM